MVVRATKEHEGRYLCQASNGVGAGLSKLITITVQGEGVLNSKLSGNRLRAGDQMIIFNGIQCIIY